ncbi:partial Inner membrane protein YdcO, partial [Burkholderiales bacterium]
RYAVVGILVLGLAFLLVQGRVDLSGLELRLAAPVFTLPAFSLNALLSIALPLFLITLTGQYMPGMLVLRNDGFKTSANPIVTVTGLGSLLMAPFGSHAFNIAAITAAICTGREAHEDPSKRWIAGMAAGVFYILVGVFGVTLAAIFMAFPATFITTLAGLALLGTIGGSLASALADAKTREASLITFVAAAANITLFGIGGAFWGLVIGLVAYAVLNGRLPQRAQASQTALQTTPEPIVAKGAAN